jgi:hypothetical protein
MRGSMMLRRVRAEAGLAATWTSHRRIWYGDLEHILYVLILRRRGTDASSLIVMELRTPVGLTSETNPPNMCYCASLGSYINTEICSSLHQTYDQISESFIATIQSFTSVSIIPPSIYSWLKSTTALPAISPLFSFWTASLNCESGYTV